MRLRLGLCLALLAAALPPSVSAQEAPDDTADSWYRIELLVFANRDPNAALAERWPLLPQLAYPANWQRLETGDPRAPADQPFELLTVEESAPATAIDLYWERSIEELMREYRYKQQLAQPRIAIDALVAPETPLDVPRQRVLLPAETRELNFQRRRIDNSAGLEVLMHQSWLQRIPSRELALPLILDGPVQFGDYPELQGSVLFYSGRYLHIATDLWLNTNGGYLDENPVTAGWSMPRPPLPLDQSEPALMPFAVSVGEDWFDNLPIAAIPLFPQSEETDPGEYRPMPEGDAETEDGISVFMTPEEEAPDSLEFEDLEREFQDPEQEDTADSDMQTVTHPPATEAEMAAFLEQPVHDYEFRHAVRVAQQRRMRSGELHYIDHPLLGIVVKVSRHEFLPFTDLDAFNND